MNDIAVLSRSEPSAATSDELAPADLQQFHEHGFCICRKLVDPAICRTILDVTHRGIVHEIPPVEYEAEVHYPGAPPSLEAEGGRTIRRLKQAHSRHIVFTELLTQPGIVQRLQQILGPLVVMPLAHHNCVMTKQPQYSSDTNWHQDIRYWSFRSPELVSLWLALGPERPDNGCLWVIPGTHRMTFSRDRFDEALFLRPDLPQNAELISMRQPVELEQGDVLLFHARTFHAAGRNRTDQPKYAAVFTFRGGENGPIPGSRSDYPELILAGPR